MNKKMNHEMKITFILAITVLRGLQIN
jgi:hypothetical protein